jgi:hypothetical protein
MEFIGGGLNETCDNKSGHDEYYFERVRATVNCSDKILNTYILEHGA